MKIAPMNKDKGGEKILDYSILNHKGFNSFEEKIKRIKVHKPYDKILKTSFKKNPNGFLEILEKGAIFEEFVDSEIINAFFRELHSDIIIRVYKKRIYIIEFQSSRLKLEDILRFGLYMASIAHQEKKDIHLYVVSKEPIKRDKIENKYGDYWFTIHVKSLTDMDYNKALNRTNNKIENEEEEFTEEDFVYLEISPLMTRKKKKQRQLLKRVAEMTNKLDGRISREKLIEIKSIQFVLATELLNDNEKAKIAKVISMQSEGKEEVFQGYLTKEERKQTYEEGREEEREEIVKSLAELDVSPDIIAKATKMSKAEIATLTTTII